MEKIKIGDFVIEKNSRPFIVGEVGVNHNGELKKAFQMIEEAKKIGLNAIKFQTFKAKEFCGDPSQTYTYKSHGKEITESMIEMFSRYEFSNDEWGKIKEKCNSELNFFEKGIEMCKKRIGRNLFFFKDFGINLEFISKPSVMNDFENSL